MADQDAREPSSEAAASPREASPLQGRDAASPQAPAASPADPSGDAIEPGGVSSQPDDRIQQRPDSTPQPASAREGDGPAASEPPSPAERGERLAPQRDAADASPAADAATEAGDARPASSPGDGSGASRSADGAAGDDAGNDAGVAAANQDERGASPPAGDPSEGAVPDADATEPPDASRGGSRVRIELPEVDAAPLRRREVRDRPEFAREREPRWVLRGAWEQIDPRDNAADYAPGGYRRGLVLIDPDAETLRVYRVFGDGLFSIAGEFTLDMWPDGTLLLGTDPKRPHRFPQGVLELPGGERVEPPVGPPDGPRRWSIRDGELELDGKRFVRISREAFDEVARGGVAATAGGPAAAGGGGDLSLRRGQGPAAADDDQAIDFFGTRIVGRYVCYVVDVSGSMAGPRLEAALAEIARSIESLPEDRFFFVLFFSGGKLALEESWLRATPRNRREFTSRLPLVQAQGGTDPRGALEHAFGGLAPVPDEVHFMTDGLVPADTPEVIRRLNSGRARTVVHTYAFGERASEAMLEAIAREHAGNYRFVP